MTDRLDGAGVRLAALTGTGRPDVTLTDALRLGKPIGEALSASGAPPAIAQYLSTEAPDDLVGVLDDVGAAWGRAVMRRTMLHRGAAYPMVVGFAVGACGLITSFGMAPALGWVASSPSQPLPVPGPDLLGFVATGLGAAVLVLFGALLRFEPDLGAFGAARRLRERALVLSGAAALASRGSTLPGALRAGAKLVNGGEVAAAAESLAAAFEAGSPSGQGAGLTGPVGAALLAAAAAEGAGAASLSALAEMAETTADRETPALALKIELFAVAVGGASLAVAAIALFRVYASAFGRLG